MVGRIVLTVVSVAGLVLVGCGDDGGDSAVTITVEVEGLTGAEGNDIAGVLFRGPGTNNPDENGMGGFNVEVDSDPFSTSQVMRQPDPDAFEPEAIDEARFPHVTDEAIDVEPGTYTVLLVLAPSPIGPGYSRWVPGTIERVCTTSVNVDQGDVTITVTGIPGETPGMPCPTR